MLLSVVCYLLTVFVNLFWIITDHKIMKSLWPNSKFSGQTVYWRDTGSGRQQHSGPPRRLVRLLHLLLQHPHQVLIRLFFSISSSPPHKKAWSLQSLEVKLLSFSNTSVKDCKSEFNNSPFLPSTLNWVFHIYCHDLWDRSHEFCDDITTLVL